MITKNIIKADKEQIKHPWNFRYVKMFMFSINATFRLVILLPEVDKTKG